MIDLKFFIMYGIVNIEVGAHNKKEIPMVNENDEPIDPREIEANDEPDAGDPRKEILEEEPAKDEESDEDDDIDADDPRDAVIEDESEDEESEV